MKCCSVLVKTGRMNTQDGWSAKQLVNHSRDLGIPKKLNFASVLQGNNWPNKNAFRYILLCKHFATKVVEFTMYFMLHLVDKHQLFTGNSCQLKRVI